MKTTFRSVLIIIAVVCAGSVIAIHRFQGFVRAQPQNEAQLENRVDNTLRERGVVESSRSIDVRCEVSGTSTILSIVPEGARVKKGDLLVELDDGSLRDRLAEAEVLVGQSKARVSQSEAGLASAKEDGAAAIHFAEQALEAALVSRERALSDGGELAYELTVTKSELAVAAARLMAAENLIGRTPEDRGPKSLDDLRVAQIEAREAIKVAEARKFLLEKYDRKTKTAMLDLAVAEKELQRARQKHAFEKARRMAEFELTASESALTQDQRKLDQIKQQIERCKIYAPQAGLVLYATANASRATRGTVIEEGAQVRERQTLIQLPDLSDLRLRVTVNESRIARVRLGQPARIQRDAFPTRDFQGKVVHVSDAPEPTSWLNADVKEYAVLVSIDGPADVLRMGLTALVEIHTGDQGRQ